jgi:hypothetical protein
MLVCAFGAFGLEHQRDYETSLISSRVGNCRIKATYIFCDMKPVILLK